MALKRAALAWAGAIAIGGTVAVFDLPWWLALALGGAFGFVLPPRWR